MGDRHDPNIPFRYPGGDHGFRPAAATTYPAELSQGRNGAEMMYYTQGAGLKYPAEARASAFGHDEQAYLSHPSTSRAVPGPSNQGTNNGIQHGMHQDYPSNPSEYLEPVEWSREARAQAVSASIGLHNNVSSDIPPSHPTSTGVAGTKKVRTQFSACQSCRNRRVKCDLKDVQEEWESLEISLDPLVTPANVAGGPQYPAGSDHKYGPSLAPNLLPGQNGNPLLDPVTGEMYRPRGVLPTGKSRPGRTGRKTRDIRGLEREELQCTNCFNRGTECVDEYGDRRERRKGGVGEMGPSFTSGDTAQGQGMDRRKAETNAGNRYNPMSSDNRSVGYPTNGQGKHHMGHLVDPPRRPVLGSHHSGSGHLQHAGGSYAQEPSVLAVSMQESLQPQRHQTFPPLERPLGLFDPDHQQTYPIASSSSARPAPMVQPGVDQPNLEAQKMTFAYEQVAPPEPRQRHYVPPLAIGPLDRTLQGQAMPMQPPVPVSVEPLRELNTVIPARPVMHTRHSGSSAVAGKPIGPGLVLDQSEGEIPDLSPEFLSSAFYRRFHIQRPICDPTDFSRRYLAHDPPRAAHLGKDGCILVHIMYAWACSYGVDATGNLDVPERNWPGGILPPETGYVWAHDQVRDLERLYRRAKTDGVVAKILKEIDEAGLMRRHSWDGVRCLLLILPLTEYVSTPMERLAMYECAVAQVFALCSLSSLGYDGLQHYLGPDGDIIRVRLYWYTFVHEGITSGLKGGRLVLDEDDLENFQASLPQGWALVTRSSAIKSVAKLATAPIRLAVACRLIHKALTGPKARKRERVDKRLMNDAWEALEGCWEEFEAIRNEPPGNFLQKDDIIRFADGWRIFMFEAHNVIRESLEHRCAHLVPRPERAFLTELSLTPEETDPRIQIHREIQHLHDIARAKCEQLTRLIVDIVKMHINTSFFEWDASLVRDGTYYAAMLLAKDHGTEEDVAICLQALNEMRWAYAKTGERSNKLRDLWAERQAKMAFPSYATPFGTSTSSSVGPPSSGMLPPAHSLMTAISSLGANVSGWMPEGMLADTSSISQAIGTDFLGDIADSAGAGAYPSTAAVPPSLEHSPTSLAGSSPPLPITDTDLPTSTAWQAPYVPGPAKGLFDAYTPPEEGRPVLPQLYHQGGVPYIQPSAGIHLSGHVGVQQRDAQGDRLVYPETQRWR